MSEIAEDVLYTTVGMIPISRLEKRRIRQDTDTAVVIRTEYYLDGVFVRNDVDVHVIKGVSGDAIAGSFPGS